MKSISIPVNAAMLKVRWKRGTFDGVFSIPACTKRLDFGPVTIRVATNTGCCPRTARSEGTKLAWTTQEHKSSSTLVTDRKETSSGSTMIRWVPKNNIDLILWKGLTTLQSKMNAKHSKQKFWHCYENGLIKTIQTYPQPRGECQVRFPLMRIRINQDNP